MGGEIYKPYSCSISAAGRANVGCAAFKCAAGGCRWGFATWGLQPEVAAGELQLGGAAAEGLQLGGAAGGVVQFQQRRVKFTNPTVVQFQQWGVQMWGLQPWGHSREVCSGE